MKLSELRLSDIGCFERHDFSFSDLTVVYGENRAGKSTLVYSLFFALYGQHLNSGLKPADLCRKGRASGTAELEFIRDQERFRAVQSTRRLPRLFRFDPDLPPDSDESGEGGPDGGEGWHPAGGHHPDAITELINVPPETAGLTSFFRESELLYFLQEVPRYNKTLLQNLIRLDEAFIIQSRLKKARRQAREYQRGVQAAAPAALPDDLNRELARRRAADARRKLAEVETALAGLSRERNDPAVYRSLLRRLEEKTTQHKRLEQELKRRPPSWELDRLLGELRSAEKTETRRQEERPPLEAERGRLTAVRDEARRRLEVIQSLAAEADCPTCGANLPEERKEKIAAAQTDRITSAETRLKELASRLSGLDAAAARIQDIAARRKAAEAAISESRALAGRLKDITEDLEEARAEFHRLFPHAANDTAGTTGALDGNAGPAEKKTVAADPAEQKAGLEAERKKLREEILSQEVLLRDDDRKRKRHAETRSHLAEAERRVLVCGTALQAVDRAIGGLGAEILTRVRRNLSGWIGLFGFLEDFDIRIGETELLPVIQARGYHYKLNQMSKSERIFLYLLLKLSIGDALGHLGFFVLDDPADGLDPERQKTLAHLLTEISRRRQVIVTTNDRRFAGCFPAARHIDLPRG
ncbi:MAG: hypothetical protein CSB33_02880 [Desulfobacterales bacterium]|nr:MAG: hypothetical protein CSB33_02880 [Desulfobacterales bacterium]